MQATFSYVFPLVHKLCCGRFWVNIKRIHKFSGMDLICYLLLHLYYFGVWQWLLLLLYLFFYMLKCILHFDMVKREFSHHIGVNCMYAPFISWLLMLQSAPAAVPRTCYYKVLCLAFSSVILLLDVKLYGQWFTTKKRFLSVVANPVSQVSVIGNLVAAQVIAEIGWKESALSVFSLGLAYYLVLFVTLYQRLTSSNKFPTVLRPAYFLFFATPSMASLVWKSISGAFVTPSKMLFFLSLFLFMSLVVPVWFKFLGLFDLFSVSVLKCNYKSVTLFSIFENLRLSSYFLSTIQFFCLKTGLQASLLQEIYEKVNRYMVGLFIPINLPWSSLCRICSRGKLEHGLWVDAGDMYGLGAGFHWFDADNSTQNWEATG